MQDCHANCHCCWPRTICTSPDDHWWMARAHWGCSLHPPDVLLQCLHPDSWRWFHLMWKGPVDTTIRMWWHTPMLTWRLPRLYQDTAVCKNVIYWTGLGKDVEYLIAACSTYQCFQPWQTNWLLENGSPWLTLGPTLFEFDGSHLMDTCYLPTCTLRCGLGASFLQLELVSMLLLADSRNCLLTMELPMSCALTRTTICLSCFGWLCKSMALWAYHQQFTPCCLKWICQVNGQDSIDSTY